MPDKYLLAGVTAFFRMIAQRVYAICCGYEDLNDHPALRQDPLMQMSIGKDLPLASNSTLCRMEQQASRTDLLALHEVLFDQFIASVDAHKQSS